MHRGMHVGVSEQPCQSAGLLFFMYKRTNKALHLYVIIV